MGGILAAMSTASRPLLPAAGAICCPPVTGGVVDDREAEGLARLFKALGDATRVKLLSLIAATGTEGACVCDLVEPVHLSQPTVSHHLRQLVEVGLVTREQRGKWAYYRLVDGALESLSDALGAATVR
jgi:ArsR family transcriptional regulator